MGVIVVDLGKTTKEISYYFYAENNKEVPEKEIDEFRKEKVLNDFIEKKDIYVKNDVITTEDIGIFFYDEGLTVFDGMYRKHCLGRPDLHERRPTFSVLVENDINTPSRNVVKRLMADALRNSPGIFGIKFWDRELNANIPEVLERNRYGVRDRYVKIELRPDPINPKVKRPLVYADNTAEPGVFIFDKMRLVTPLGLEKEFSKKTEYAREYRIINRLLAERKRSINVNWTVLITHFFPAKRR